MVCRFIKITLSSYAIGICFKLKNSSNVPIIGALIKNAFKKAKLSDICIFVM